MTTKLFPGIKNIFHTRPTLVRWLYWSLLVCALLSYLNVYPIPELREKCLALFGSLFFVGEFIALGRFLRRRIAPVSTEDWKESLPIAFGLGAGSVGFITILLGWGVPGPLKVKILLIHVALITLLVYETAGVLPRLNRIKFSLVSLGYFDLISLFVGFAGFSLCVLSAFSPITYYDSLVYHVALPAIYAQQGFIGAIPHNLYSFFPAQVEMLFLHVLLFFPAPDYVINLLGLSFSFFTLILLVHWAKRLAAPLAPRLLFFLWWTMPAVLFLSIGGYIDIPLAFFSTLAAYAFFKWRRNSFETSSLVLAGLFSGMALATKYTGGVIIILLSASLLFTQGAQKKQILRSFGIFMVTALLPAIPWFLKNFLSTGNPVFPFLYRYFPTPALWQQESAARYFQMLTEYKARSRVLYELFVSPWTESISMLQFGGGFDVLGDFGWGLLLLLLPLSFFSIRKRPGGVWIFLITVGFMGFWALTKPVLRFLVPALPLLVLLIATTLSDEFEKGRLRKFAVSIFIGPWIIGNFLIYAHVTDVTKPFDVCFGRQSKNDFLTKSLPIFEAYSFLNNSNLPGAVFILGEQRTYHLKRPCLASPLFADSPLAEIINQPKTDGELHNYFSKNGIQLFLISQSEINRLGGFNGFGISDQGATNLFAFLNGGGRLIYNSRGILIFNLNALIS